MSIPNRGLSSINKVFMIRHNLCSRFILVIVSHLHDGFLVEQAHPQLSIELRIKSALVIPNLAFQIDHAHGMKHNLLCICHPSIDFQSRHFSGTPSLKAGSPNNTWLMFRLKDDGDEELFGKFKLLALAILTISPRRIGLPSSSRWYSIAVRHLPIFTL